MINRIYYDKLTGLSNKHYSGIFCYTSFNKTYFMYVTDLFESQETNCHKSFFYLTFLSDEPAVLSGTFEVIIDTFC